MFKSILVPLFGLDRDTASLGTALATAKRFDARLECVHVRPDPRQVLAGVSASMEMGGAISHELWTALLESDKQRAARARETFDTFCRANRIETSAAAKGLSAAFREVEADPAKELTASARFSDAVVLATSSIAGEGAWGTAGDIVIGAGRPVILAPEEAPATLGTTIAIAWKETAESARAVGAAMPLLAKAKMVTVLSAREGSFDLEHAEHSANRLAELLRLHGLPAQAKTVKPGAGGIADTVMNEARAIGSDLLVMGAYGHTRMREFILGGFTRRVLEEASLPVFLLH